jgi:hypothetical protein
MRGIVKEKELPKKGEGEKIPRGLSYNIKGES